jgi:hypothetical protein
MHTCKLGIGQTCKLGIDHHARSGTVHLHAKHLLATCRTAHRPSLYKDACMPRYMPHRPSIRPHRCHWRQASKSVAHPRFLAYKRHVGLLSHSSTLSSPLACLLSLHLPRVYRIRPNARAGLDRHHMTR